MAWKFANAWLHSTVGTLELSSNSWYACLPLPSCLAGCCLVADACLIPAAVAAAAALIQAAQQLCSAGCLVGWVNDKTYSSQGSQLLASAENGVQVKEGLTRTVRNILPDFILGLDSISPKIHRRHKRKLEHLTKV
jgi:hypothetical protein